VTPEHLPGPASNARKSAMIKKLAVFSILCLAGTGVAFAAASLGDQREAAMKKISHSAGALVAIAKGKTAYDAATVKTSLKTISATIKTFPDLFPAGSEKADRAASPKIWTDNASFKAHAAKLGADADALLAALPADRKGVIAAVGTLGEACGTCHQDFRLKD
jgi:cytochrome c556